MELNIMTKDNAVNPGGNARNSKDNAVSPGGNARNSSGK